LGRSCSLLAPAWNLPSLHDSVCVNYLCFIQIQRPQAMSAQAACGPPTVRLPTITITTILLPPTPSRTRYSSTRKGHSPDLTSLYCVRCTLLCLTSSSVVAVPRKQGCIHWPSTYLSSLCGGRQQYRHLASTTVPSRLTSPPSVKDRYSVQTIAARTTSRTQ
jgi:hypothetical protein